jgi:Zn-dependent peptidase ImmA (M78 family)
MQNDYTLLVRAFETRVLCGEDSISPFNIFRAVASIGEITLVFYPFTSNLSGMCIKDPNSTVIALNSSSSYGRQRFTLAHELYHYFYDKEGLTLCINDFESDKTDIEKEADTFASFLLMPPMALKQFIEKHNGNKLFDEQLIVGIENHFEMSRQATLVRLKKEGLIGTSEFERFSSNIIRSALKYGFSSKLYKPNNEIQQYTTLGHYVTLAEDLLKQGYVTQGKYEELLLEAFRSDIVYGTEEIELYD